MTKRKEKKDFPAKLNVRQKLSGISQLALVCNECPAKRNVRLKLSRKMQKYVTVFKKKAF